MNVLMTKKLMTEDVNYIQSKLNSGINLIFPERYDEDSLLVHAPKVDVLFGGFFSERLLEYTINLKFAQVPWTGIDNLDFSLLRRFNVILCNSHSNALVVAEHAVSMMMDVAKKLSYHDRELRKGNWNRILPDRSNPISPFSKKIVGSTVGFIGFGAIARYAVKLLAGFECRYKVFTRSGLIPDEYSKVITANLIGDFFSQAEDLDFIFVSIPLTEETNGMINHNFFHAMPKGSILINVSRGQVLNQRDLYDSLKGGHLGGAAIDTWYNYPSPQQPVSLPSLDFPFHLLDQVVLSPHRAGYVESGFPHLDDAIENLNRFQRGDSLINVVSLELKY